MAYTPLEARQRVAAQVRAFYAELDAAADVAKPQRRLPRLSLPDSWARWSALFRLAPANDR